MKEAEFVMVRVDVGRDWKAAVCEELQCSGFGATIPEALASCGRSIASTLASQGRLKDRVERCSNGEIEPCNCPMH